MTPSLSQLVETLFWPSIDDSGEPLDSSDYQPSAELLAKLETDFADFTERASWIPGFQGEDHYIGARTPGGQLEHDFILTRNGHGCGFWEIDDWEPIYGAALTDICREMGEIQSYAGDNGLICV